ncbi:unnamed protein product [Litomosoides sigmodontis]|uniref:Uncharacterized protein n=1 Tax=Litomosoides sigmodontis TaxID=42156 RepID=A0A3P6UBS9_LITSI|nr:unnamed protein product [Litomosoides sigmodontis]
MHWYCELERCEMTNMTKLLVIAFIKLTTVVVGQVWYPYEMYHPFQYSNSYQALGYDSGCAAVVLAGVPCQQPARQWNLYPDYQSSNYNINPYIGMMSHMFVPPYDTDGVVPESSDITMDLLKHGILLDSTKAAGSTALDPKLLGANILNDKNRFEAHGCSYDAAYKKCADNLNRCRGRCKNFGDNIAHDCKCVPEDLLTILGLTEKIWK